MFYVGIKVVAGVVQDVLAYNSQEETEDNLRDSMARSLDEGAKDVRAEVYEMDLDGNASRVYSFNPEASA